MDGAHENLTAPSATVGDAAEPDLARIFDTIEFRDAYRISYLANAIVVPAPTSKSPHGEAEATPARTRAAMSWMQRLRRVFDIDISRCP